MNFREIPKFIAAAVCFIVLAAVTRDTLRLVETRIQIAGFVTVAAAYEWWLRPRLGRLPSKGAFLVNALLATAALLGVRWQLEGLCPGYRRIHCLPEVYAGLPYRSDADGRVNVSGTRVSRS
jgi:hypothetical protein